MATVLVVQPGADDPLGRFAGWLGARGVTAETVCPFRGEPIPQRLTGDGLIVLGGAMSSTDDTGFPWLEHIRVLFRDAIRRGLPTLGICLGAQLLAQALGGTVRKGADGLECGAVIVHTTADVAGDPLFDGTGPDFPVASMHEDAIELLPPASVLLGTSETYPHQAFRAGPSAWGVQFHPEIGPDTYASWVRTLQIADPAARSRATHGVGTLTAADATVQQTAGLLADRFARLVTGSR